MTDGPAALLAVEELSAFYGSALILDGLSLSVAPGEVVVLLGEHPMKGSYETHGVGLGRREDS